MTCLIGERLFERMCLTQAQYLVSGALLSDEEILALSEEEAASIYRILSYLDERLRSV